MTTREEATATAISESSGMRFDGFWSRVEELEPEDREYALKEASAALAAADAWELKQDIHRFKIDPETVNRAALAFCDLPESPADACEDCRDDALAALRALRHAPVLAAVVKEEQ